ncbi:MAG: hypothetical protein WCX16_00425 [Candidatus Omnitrophota bacterium]
MAFFKFLSDKFNLALLGFISLFIFIPFLESQAISFPPLPFIFLFIFILLFRMLSLPLRPFLELLLLAILAFCLDLLLIFVLNNFLEGVLTVVIHGMYAFCFIACLWILVKRFHSSDMKPHDLVKMGFCGYFSIGFLWMVFYSLAFAFNPRAFSGLFLENVRFFYFSFSSLALLIPSSQLISMSFWVKYLVLLEALAGQVFLVIFIVRAVVLYRSYETER